MRARAGHDAERDVVVSSQLPQLWTGLRRPLDNGLPGHVIGAAEKAFDAAGPKSRAWMPAAAWRSRSALITASFSLSSPSSHSAASLSTLRCASLTSPSILVDEHIDLDAVERRLHAELCHLVPAQIENAGDRPAVSIGDPALERGVELAGRAS